MTFGPWLKQLDVLLAALATSTGMVPDEQDREVLAQAARILADPDRLVTSSAGRPMVLIDNGYSADPVVEAVDEIEQRLEAAIDEIHTILSNHDDLRRLLRQRIEATG